MTELGICNKSIGASQKEEYHYTEQGITQVHVIIADGLHCQAAQLVSDLGRDCKRRRFTITATGVCTACAPHKDCCIPSSVD